MSKFKDFLVEQTFPASRMRPSGFYNFPNMHQHHGADMPPVGGYDPDNFFSQKTQHNINVNRAHGPIADLHYKAQSLQKFAILAEQIAAALHNTHLPQTRFYHTASIDPVTKNIVGLTRNEVEGGHYPNLHQDEVRLAEQLGIFKNQGGNVTIDVNRLRIVMNETQQAMMKMTRDQEKMTWGAGQVDALKNAALNNAMQSNLQRSKAVD